MNRFERWFIQLLLPLPSVVLAATTDNGQREFELGQVEVKAKTVMNIPADEQVLKAATLEKFDANNIAQGLNLMTGVNIDFIGGRNETGLRVRGFDSRQMPIFLDGIPQYVPYDGYVDFSRFLTTDLSEIHLSKSGASLLYGANTLGGAINLVSRKPVNIFELNGASGFNSAGDKLQSLNIGSNNGLFYTQGDFGFIDSHKFRLPKHFKDEKASPTDEGHYRQNAQYIDRKYGFKVGITPENGDEYALGYSAIRSEKGQPTYVGDSTKTRTKYWRWPQWDKDSYYFLGNTQVDNHNRLQLRLYHDSYKNTVDMYRDAHYAELQGAPSIYHDKTVGGSINWINTRFSNQLWQFSYQYKRDEHHDLSSREVFRDATQVLATENKIRFTPEWQLRWGISHEKQYSRLLPVKFNKGTASSTNALAELSYQLNPQQMLYGNVSSRSRFPTLKDRYSYRMGAAIPNADLRTEKVTSMELGWKNQTVNGLSSNIALFYSRLRDEIQNVYVKDTQHQCPSGKVIGYCLQDQNIGKTRHLGIEVSLDKQFNSHYKAGINYTYLARKNLNDPHTPLLDTPRHKIFSYVQYQPMEKLAFLASAAAEKGRRTSYGNKWRTLNGFVRLDSKMVWQPAKKWQVETGVQNLTDKNYEFSDGYPMAGRTWFANIRYAL